MERDVESMRAASHRGHLYIQWVLRAGLAIGAALLVVGLVIAIAKGERDSGATHLHTVFTTGSLADRLMGSGLLILAFTPVFRVLALVAIWIHERDRRFTLVGLAVVAILAGAMLTGHG